MADTERPGQGRPDNRPPQTPPGQAGKPPKPAQAAGLRSLHASDGWLAMYWTGTEHRGDDFSFWGIYDEEEFPVPIRYTVAGTWVRCDEEPSFCAVIPLGVSLEDFGPQCPHPVPRSEGRG